MDSISQEKMGSLNRKGNIKVTRDDWISVAIDLLITKGIDHVRIQNIGKMLNVSRSSFYGYFEDQNDLHQALLDEWHNRNTVNLITEATAPCATITEAVLGCFAVRLIQQDLISQWILPYEIGHGNLKLLPNM